jgi:hypothetical protein
VVSPEDEDPAVTLRLASTFALCATADKLLAQGKLLRFGACVRSCAATVRQAVLTAVLLVAGSSTAFACPMCFGAEESSMIDGTKLGVVVMLGITLAVQGGFLGFFLYLRKHAKRIADVELDTEWTELQRGSRTS